jgi:hypothetical protein
MSNGIATWVREQIAELEAERTMLPPNQVTLIAYYITRISTLKEVLAKLLTP